MTEDPKPPVKPDPTPPSGDWLVNDTEAENGINVRNEGVGEYPWSDKKHGNCLHKVLVSGPRDEVEKSQREHDGRLQDDFRERLDREIAQDGQLYDRVAQVEQVLAQSLPDIPDHLRKRVVGLVERDRERRAKLRTAYMEEAEEYRDNGDQPEREIFLALADWVKNGVGSVRQHSQLLDEFNSARDEYNENRRDDYE